MDKNSSKKKEIIYNLQGIIKTKVEKETEE
jgi:hypothetical protein